jgi:hypothetical protein
MADAWQRETPCETTSKQLISCLKCTVLAGREVQPDVLIEWLVSVRQTWNAGARQAVVTRGSHDPKYREAKP